MTRLNVGWDLDGVGYIFFASVHHYLTLSGHGHLPEITDEKCDVWEAHQKYWGMTDDEFNKHCDDGVNAGIVFGPGEQFTRPNFFEAMRAVKQMGHRNIIITHRWQGNPGRAEANTYEWLKPVHDVIDDVKFSHDKTSVKTDIFIEDNLKNYDHLVAAGTKAVLVNRTWNRVPGDSRVRIDDVAQYPAVVDLLTHFNQSVV